jgi:hypothetical protein
VTEWAVLVRDQIDRGPMSQKVWHDDIDPSLLQALSAPSIGLNPAALQLGFIGNGDISIEVKNFLVDIHAKLNSK